MILTEQQYKNLNRKYYHGSYCGTLREEKKSYIYLTTSFVYSALYACQTDPLEGKVFEFRLKEGLNIFNAKSRQDIMKLRVYAKKNNLGLGERIFG